MSVTWTKETIDNTGYSTDSINSASLTVDNVKIDGTTIGHTDDTNLLTLANGALTVDGTLTTGASGTGHDVTFYGNTSSEYMLWDASQDRLEIHTTGNAAGIALHSTDTDAAHGPAITLSRDVAGADNDSIGTLDFYGQDDGGNSTLYARVYSQILTAGDGSERGSLQLKAMTESASGNTIKTGIWIKGSTTNDEVTVTIPNGGLSIGKDTELRGSVTLFDGGGTNTPGYITFYQPNGTPKYVWVDNSGDLMIHSSIPTDSGGTVVGSQS
jgi:hypothetical protein